jgi:hypothetical protein
MLSFSIPPMTLEYSGTPTVGLADGAIVFVLALVKPTDQARYGLVLPENV